MEYRVLGDTGFKVSTLGFGAWGIGGSSKKFLSYGDIDPKESFKTIEYAIIKGINFFDTAPSYGEGLSEEIIGSVVKKLKQRNNIFIATKNKYENLENYIDLKKNLLKSLNRLKTDYVDLYQLHNPNINDLKKNGEIISALIDLKKKGLIRKVGVSVKNPNDILELKNYYFFDAYQVNFNMMDQRIIDLSIIDECELNNFGLIARTPLFFGFLTGSINETTHFNKNDHRSMWTKDQIKLWVKGAEDMFSIFTLKNNKEKSIYALNFCISHPRISSTLSGMMNVEEVKNNLAIYNYEKMSPELLQKIRVKYKEIEKKLFLKK